MYRYRYACFLQLCLLCEVSLSCTGMLVMYRCAACYVPVGKLVMFRYWYACLLQVCLLCEVCLLCTGKLVMYR